MRLLLLAFGLFSAALVLPDESIFAADPNHVAQLRATKKCVRCDLREADLKGADLTGADLTGADLTGARLNSANLTGAKLNWANLTGATLIGAKLMEAELLTANLAGAQLDRADLTGAKPIGANLIEANLNWANLSRADLTGADLTGADLIEANLSAANLIEANLSKAQLPRANLSGADLNLAKLIEARPVRANLTGANLNWADLSRADLSGANLSGATFEPYVLPPTGAFLGVTGLDTLQWKNSPQALVLLRNGFKDAGRREQERQTTYSLMKWTRINTGGIEGALQYGFFELTTDWGMTPARPLWILLALVPGFALLYMIPVLRPSPGGAALWRVWDKDRARKDQGQDDPERLLARSYRAPLYGLFFSVLSAFQIGWKELSIGSWIARLNPYEYTLKATGWVRTVSGVQSLISVYLLALAVLTYFGRPFE